MSLLKINQQITSGGGIEKKLKRYSPERKEAVLTKLLPPHNRCVTDVAKEEGISEQTLYNWLKKLKQTGKAVPGNKGASDKWSAESKLAIVSETMSLSEKELSRYCREKGLYPEQIASWKAACLQGFSDSQSQNQAVLQQTRADKKQIKSLKAELREKEKALAETAALLVLRKKLRAFYGEEPEDE